MKRFLHWLGIHDWGKWSDANVIGVRWRACRICNLHHGRMTHYQID